LAAVLKAGGHSVPNSYPASRHGSFCLENHMNIENEVIQELAALTGLSPEDIIRLAVCRLIDAVTDAEVSVRKELMPELQAELAIVKAGRHGVTQILAQRGDDALRARLAGATKARQFYERGMAHAERLRGQARAA
jgi:hypothetical protein